MGDAKNGTMRNISAISRMPGPIGAAAQSYRSLGEKSKLIISSDFGYGERGAGGDIPPNADLEFDVELVSVASGPVAELVAQLGLGLNTRTALIALLGLTFVPGLIPQ